MRKRVGDDFSNEFYLSRMIDAGKIRKDGDFFVALKKIERRNTFNYDKFGDEFILYPGDKFSVEYFGSAWCHAIIDIITKPGNPALKKEIEI